MNHRETNRPEGWRPSPRSGFGLVLPEAKSATDSVAFAAGLAASLAAMSIQEFRGPVPLLAFSSFNLFAVDLAVAAILLAISLVASARKLSFTTLEITLFILVSSYIFSITAGSIAGTPQYLSSLRGATPLPVMLLLAIFTNNTQRVFRRGEQVLFYFSIVLSLLVAVRLLFGGALFMQTTNIHEYDINDGGRPIAALGAFVLAIAATLSTYRALLGGKWALLWTAIFSTALLASGQGTAGICGAVSVATVIALTPGPRRRTRLTLTIVGSLIVGGVLALYSQNVFNDFLPNNVTHNLSQRQVNLDMRKLIWGGYWRSYLEFSDWEKLLGRPLGQDRHVELQSPQWGHVRWAFSAHSMYVGSLAGIGLLGLVAYLGILATLLRRAAVQVWRCQSTGGIPAIVALACVLAVIVFGYSYEVREDGFALAFAVIALRTQPVAAHIGLRTWRSPMRAGSREPVAAPIAAPMRQWRQHEPKSYRKVVP